jgi:hypothetical protein
MKRTRDPGHHITRGTVVVVAAALLLPFAVAGGGGLSAAVADPSALTGVVTLPGGVPAAAAVVDVSALSETGVVVTTFAQAVTDESGRFTARVPATASLRLLARRTNGLRLRVAVTDLAPHGTGAPPTAYAKDVTGLATLHPPAPARFSTVAGPARRAAATLTNVVLDVLAVVNPAGVLRAVAEGPAPASGTRLPANAVTAVADLVFARTVGSPPSLDGYVAYLQSIADPLQRQAYQAVIDAAGGVTSLLGRYTDLHAWLNRLAVYQGGDGSGGDRDAVGETLDAIQRLVALVGGAVPDYQPWIDQARAAIDRSMAEVLGRVPVVTGTGLALADLVAALALGIVNDPQQAYDTAQQVVDEASGVTDGAVFAVSSSLDAALATVEPYVTSTSEAGRRMKNYDPDVLLGNEDVDDPDLVPPLNALMAVVPMSGASDPAAAIGESPLTPAGAAVDGLFQSAEEGGAADGCTTINTQIVPAKGKGQPVEGLTMRVVLTIYHCKNETDRDHDYYALGWKGFATNTDSDEFHYALWRLKFRTDLPGTFARRDQDPTADRSEGGSFSVPWSVSFPSVGGINGSYDVVKAKKIHPWSDGDGKLFHVSWISNYDEGSSGAQFWNGGGNAFLVPNGTGDAAVVQAMDPSGAKPGSNTIDVWKCATSKDTRAVRCDPR